MSELPRFENVDLTPTWDDVDPAELDFGGGALDPEPVAAGFDTGAAVEEVEEPDVEESEAELDLPPELDHSDEGEDAGEIDVEIEAELAEAPVAAPVEDEPTDEFAGLDDADMQFGDGPIGVDTVPDDFDL